MNNRAALVLGATGGIGSEVASRLVRSGWRVRAMARHVGQTAGMEWVRGDAMSASDVAAAAQGASVIVHAVNPPGYRKWNEVVLPMIDNTIAAARREGARVVLPGTVYNFGPDAFEHPLDETAAQVPVTRKGKIRVELEQRLEHGGVKALIVRAGDFFGPKAGNNWFGQLAKPGKPIRSITYPGRRGVGHQWAYLPDVAETMVQLLERDTLADFARFHMRGHWDADGTQMTGAIRRVIGEDVPVRRFPWPIVWLASPFVPLFRELWEMRYLWSSRVEMRNDRLVAELGAEPNTPLDQAVRTTLEGLGCLAPHGHAAAMPA